MSKIIVSDAGGGGDFEICPEGNHVARCIALIHIGTIKENINGTEKTLNKVRVLFETPTEKTVFVEERGEEPFVIGMDFTASLNEKANLRKTLKSWRGRDFTPEELEAFDLANIVGAPCLANVVHEASKKDPAKKYVKIVSVSALPKGMVCPDAISEKYVFGYDPFSPETFKKLPDWIKEKVKSSAEYKALPADLRAKAEAETQEPEVKSEPPATSDDVPF